VPLVAPPKREFIHGLLEHPEWIIWRSETPGQKAPDPSVYATQILPVYGLLNYGLPKVREYVVSMVDRMVRRYGIRYIRYDCNIAPLIYWESVDQPHRRGAAQIRHVEGLYEVLERIRKLHPDLLLEGCASGGRRIDLQTARHFHSFWISDHTYDPHIVRWHLHGIQHFLPGNYAYACYVLPLPNRKQFDLSDLSFQSFFGGAFGTGGRIDEWPAELAARARTHVRVYKTIRKYLLEDFFPLTPQPQTLESWQAWQFHDPRLDEGFVQIFRLESTEEQQAFALKALNASAVYQCMDAYTLEMWKQSGRELTSEGIKLAVPRMASRVVLYRKTG
jgi:alpha-galactosidase